MSGERARRRRVPVGEDADRWTTRQGCVPVLLVVHNVTSATRLLDVLPLFHDDLGVQLLVTCTDSSPFDGGTAELLAATELPVLGWEQACETPVALVITASFGGQLHRLRGPVVALSHGVGYNKRLATPDTGHRTPVRRGWGRRWCSGCRPSGTPPGAARWSTSWCCPIPSRWSA